ncbi:MAG: RNA-binding transcriptional accessory protein [Rikenellaceae bacterium]|nr:RNA-binding transcriptional accessory protein [Rikenellaceae bacterium]
MTESTPELAPLIASQLSLPRAGVAAAVRLLTEGATVPFISRYRKEATGSLDEVQIEHIRAAMSRLTELLKRRATVLETIDAQGKLTPELRSRIEACYDAAELEDIYLPYKPKRRTRATAAREKGLEPLAAQLMRQDGARPETLAARYVKGDVADAAEALDGASDIIAEWVSESDRARGAMRRLFAAESVVTSRVVKGKEQEGVKYADYFGFASPLRRMPSHRLLALLRGQHEGVLRLAAAPDEERALAQLDRIFLKGNSPARELIGRAIRDSYKRLLRPSMETETLAAARMKADTEAIRVFAANLRQLLLAAPLGQKRVLAVDPGFRTGCKVVCLDAQGALLHNETIYPHAPQNRAAEAAARLKALVSEYRIEAVAVGDGTAGRETERLIAGLRLPDTVQVFMVSEDGASVYSASALGREEFPDRDVTVRGAVSIGRRLIDPLSELVKIDPKSIGVGQYQHDVDQGRLRESLDATVMSCVNGVGVNLNTASRHLLAYVSGLNATTARNIVDYRTEHGPFASRRELLKVPRLGDKAFEQCAGFLRIPDGRDPLDASAVHPESYPVVGQMAADLGVSVAELLKRPDLQRQIDLRRYVTDRIGLPSLTDIMAELARPGRDPRGAAAAFAFDESVHTVDDLREGMVLPGIVTNITAFGAFVDVGVKQDGLVHISQLADRYVADPNDAVRLQQPVMVRVASIDRARGRIGLSMRGVAQTGDKS